MAVILAVVGYFGDAIGRGYCHLHIDTLADNWYNISSANSFGLGGTYRDDMTKSMNPAAIEEAQSRARVCMASNYTDCD